MDTGTAIHLLNQYGYFLILGWTFLEGETIVIIAGFIAQTGKLELNPWLVALAAFLGTFASDQLMFALGKYKGVGVLKRFPHLNRNTEKARRLILKYETGLILGFRFIYGVRNVTPLLLGISGVSHAKFFGLNLIGALVWALTFTFGGYYFGHLFTEASEHLAHAELWLIATLLTCALAFTVGKRLLAKRRGVSMVPETDPAELLAPVGTAELLVPAPITVSGEIRSEAVDNGRGDP